MVTDEGMLGELAMDRVVKEDQKSGYIHADDDEEELLVVDDKAAHAGNVPDEVDNHADGAVAPRLL